MSYTPTIGLEIHAELKTRTKMFCTSRNDPDEERPNVNICPVCTAHPGTLPVVNRDAVRQVLRVGAALGGELADYTEFDRKNYFYPDLPKGYQISQYEFPLVRGGMLAGISITRIHLEEDTATSKHQGEHSIVDFNRAGIPLMELVTEPVIHDAQTAGSFARELQLLLRTLGAGEANMEKGQMRVEANISVSRDSKLGIKTEVKNLNSFRSVERAIAYEIERQTGVLESGGTLVQETRGFNEDTGETFSQRLKESSHDYRYFPDPDIPKFKLSLTTDLSADAIRLTLPMLPWERRSQLTRAGVPKDIIEVIISDDGYAAAYTEGVSGIGEDPVRSAAINLLFGPIRGTNPTPDQLKRVASALPAVARLYVAGGLSSSMAVQVLGEIAKVGGDPESLARERGWLQESSPEEITRLAEKLIQDNAKVAADIKSGKSDALKFLVGQGMRVSGGKINPLALSDKLREMLLQ